MIHFEWDENKNNSNVIKHGVDFIESESAFYDNNALVIPDPDHSEDEERFILIGLSLKGNLLVVVHCYRNNDETIRIISSRKATKREEIDYLKG